MKKRVRYSTVFDVRIRDGPRISPGDDLHLRVAKFLYKLGLARDRDLEDPASSAAVAVFEELLSGWRSLEELSSRVPRTTAYRLVERMRETGLVEEGKGEGRKRRYRVRGGDLDLALDFLETNVRVYLRILRMEAARLREGL